MRLAPLLLPGLPVLLLLCFVRLPVARAQAPARETASDTTPARNHAAEARKALALGHRGLTSYHKGEYARALELFLQADEIAHSPVFVLYQARSLAQLGRYAMALELYDECARLKLDDPSPQAWLQATLDAKLERAALSGRVGMLDLSLLGEVRYPVDIRVRAEGDEESKAAKYRLESGGIQLFEDPGGYQLVVVDASGARGSFPWRAIPGAARRLAMDLSYPDPSSSAPASRQAPSLMQPNHERPPSSLRTGAYVAALSGTTLIAGSLVMGGVAIGLGQEVKNNCPQNPCPQEEFGKAQRALTYARLATAIFVGGAVGLGAGVTLWLVDKYQRPKLGLGLEPSKISILGNF